MKLMKQYKAKRSIYYVVLSLLVGALLLYVSDALASSGTGGIGDVANTLTTNFSNLAKLITAISYIAGLGFAVASIFKFKAHKDNPTQVPVGTPLALLFIGAALIFMPSVFQVAGKTVFGTTSGSGGATGTDPFSK